MKGMDHSDMDMGSDKKIQAIWQEGHGNMKMEGHDMSTYDLFTINGKSGDLVEPLKVNKEIKFVFDSLMLVIYYMIYMFTVMI